MAGDIHPATDALSEDRVFELNPSGGGFFPGPTGTFNLRRRHYFNETRFNPDDPLGHETTVGASLLAKNFASKLAPTLGEAAIGQSGFNGIERRVSRADIAKAGGDIHQDGCIQVHGGRRVRRS